MGGLAVGVAGLAGAYGGAVYLYILANPAVVEGSLDFTAAYLPTGAPAASWAEYAGATAGYLFGHENFLNRKG